MLVYFCYFIDVNHMRMSDGTNKVTTTTAPTTTIFWLSPSIDLCNWIDFISVAYASWYHWNCGRTQRKAATINQLACPSYSLYAQLLWYPMYYPGGMKARVSPVQWSKPYSILAPTQDSNPGGRIQNHKRWPLHYHCTLWYLSISGLSAVISDFPFPA